MVIRLPGGRTCYQLHKYFSTFRKTVVPPSSVQIFFMNRPRQNFCGIGFGKRTSNAWFQASAANQMKPALFRDLTQRTVAIPYRLFGIIFRSYLRGSRQPVRTVRPIYAVPTWCFRLSSSASPPFTAGPTGCSKTSVTNYHYMLQNVPEERRSHTSNICCLKIVCIFKYLKKQNRRTRSFVPADIS